MNSYVLFGVGVLLGVLLTMSIGNRIISILFPNKPIESILSERSNSIEKHPNSISTPVDYQVFANATSDTTLVSPNIAAVISVFSPPPPPTVSSSSTKTSEPSSIPTNDPNTNPPKKLTKREIRRNKRWIKNNSSSTSDGSNSKSSVASIWIPGKEGHFMEEATKETSKIGELVIHDAQHGVAAGKEEEVVDELLSTSDFNGDEGKGSKHSEKISTSTFQSATLGMKKRKKGKKKLDGDNDSNSNPANSISTSNSNSNSNKKAERKRQKNKRDVVSNSKQNNQPPPLTSIDFFYTLQNETILRKSVAISQLYQFFTEQPQPNIKYSLYPPWTSYHAQAYNDPINPIYLPTYSYIVQAHTILQNFLTQHKDNLLVVNPMFYNQWGGMIETINKPFPNMTLQRAGYEKDNLKLHLCNGVFEAYSASYLTTKKHMIEGIKRSKILFSFFLVCSMAPIHIFNNMMFFFFFSVKSENFNLTWVNCEMASFIHIRESNNFYSNANGAGLIMQVTFYIHTYNLYTSYIILTSVGKCSHHIFN